MADTSIHGPMWQFECHVCDFMGDVWDTKAQAVEEGGSHDCFHSVTDAWAREEINRLRDLLYEAEQYMEHRPNCNLKFKCDCGYNKVWNQIND